MIGLMRLFDLFEEESISNSIPELIPDCGVVSSGETLDSSLGLGILIAFVYTYKLFLFFSLALRDNFVNSYVAVLASDFSIFHKDLC